MVHERFGFAKPVFDRQTRKRFARMQACVAGHAGEVEQWQLQGKPL